MTFFEYFTEFVGWLAFPFGAFVIGASIIIFGSYSQARNRMHIALMAFSYSIMSVLMVLTVNYRIFYDGTPRLIGSAALLVAFISGTLGLALMFRRMGEGRSGSG